MLDLIMLSLVSDYAVKKELFLDVNKGLSLHTPLVSYQTFPEDYFISLPSTRNDEATIHSLLAKKQLTIIPPEGIMKEIVVSIVDQLANRKAGAKSVYTSTVSVDYCSLFLPGFLTCSMQMHLQFLLERNVTPYILRPTPEQRRVSCNIYGHNHRTIIDLQSTTFKQFWELYSTAEKQTILTIDVKDILSQARESVYWFVIRYVILHWDTFAPLTASMGLTKNGTVFVIEESTINLPMLSTIIAMASAYDTTVSPPAPSCSSSLFCETLPEGTADEDSLNAYCVERFRLFFYWLLCYRMNFAFQMHQREEEANRMAASLLNEDLGSTEASGKKKKRRRNKKKDVVAAPEPASVEEVVVSKESQLPSSKGSQSTSSKVSQSTSSKPSQSTPSKPPQLTPSKPSQPTPPLPQTPNTPATLLSKTTPSQLPSPKPKKSRPDIQRITRFLLGERREKTDTIALPDRKHSLSPEPETPFVSLRQVLQRNDPLASLLENSEPLLSVEEEMMVLPPTDAVINQLVSPARQKDEERNEYAIPPSQLLQRTLQESMEWTEDVLKDPSAPYVQGFTDSCNGHLLRSSVDPFYPNEREYPVGMNSSLDTTMWRTDPYTQRTVPVMPIYPSSSYQGMGMNMSGIQPPLYSPSVSERSSAQYPGGQFVF